MDPPLENDGFIKMRTAKQKSRFNRNVYYNDVIVFTSAIIAIIALNSYGLLLPTANAIGLDDASYSSSRSGNYYFYIVFRIVFIFLNIFPLYIF